MSAPIGVLALQGGVEPHLSLLRHLGFVARPVREADEILACAGLVLPGGESTTQRTLIARFALGAALDTFVASRRPLLATCAGLVVAAQRRWLDVCIERNAYGSQLHSFHALTDAPFAPTGGPTLETRGQPLLFIRAPRIVAYGPAVRVLSRVQGAAVAVAQDAVVATCAHPELTGVDYLHRYTFGGTGGG